MARERQVQVQCLWGIAAPAARLRIVMGTPPFAYSQKPISTRPRARCTTIKFATDPSTVRFPASVDDIASVSHACAASGKRVTKLRKTSTAGTLLTRFESAAEKTVMG